ncbi:MAG: GNAT family N-acetyltransferase [Verrucomicrobiota bacterium]
MFTLRPMVKKDFDEVAELIYLSTNSWYQEHLGRKVFAGDSQDCRLFCEVYEELDPEGGLVVENAATGMIVGSCFFHPRETHVSLGIMNVHPNYFGKKIAAKLLQKIIEEAEMRQLPLRLISSAMNLDSFSLYSRFGFRPCDIYQDLLITVPKNGLGVEGPENVTVREAEPSDLVAMGRVEFEVCGISRERDYCYFLENKDDLWTTFVSENESGEVDGFLVSIDQPGCCMIGPGAAQTAASAESLLLSQLDLFRGRSVVFLLPAKERALIDAAYRWGAKNCEMHFTQVRGESQPVVGVVLPTFLPESA